MVAGQKIQNWHQPLGKHDARTSYLRTRFADPEIQPQAKQVVNLSVFLDEDFDIGANLRVHNKNWRSYERDEEANILSGTNLFQVWNSSYSSNDRTLQVPRDVYCPIQGQNAAEARKAFLQSPGAQTQYRIDILLDWFQKRSSTTFLRGLAIPESETISSENLPLEQRLADFVDRLLLLADQSISTSKLPALLFSGCDYDAISFLTHQIKQPHLRIAACLLAPFWVRDPFTCDSSLNDFDFVKALFGAYEAPECLLLQGSRFQSKYTLKWFCWFILLAQGGSLRQAANLFGWWIPKRIQVHLSAHARETSVEKLMMRLWLQNLGASTTDCERILQDRRYVFDPSNGLQNSQVQNFLMPVFQWLIRHAQNVLDLEYRQILDWMFHLRTETELEQPLFSLQGLNLEMVLQYNFEYAQSIGRVNGNFVWATQGFDWSFTDAQKQIWTITELLNSADLAFEGQVMQHCVAGYAQDCSRGMSAIFSMQKNCRQEITIEINPVSLRMAQARGYQNRAANTEEHTVLNQWLKHVLEFHRSENTGIWSDELE